MRNQMTAIAVLLFVLLPSASVSGTTNRVLASISCGQTLSGNITSLTQQDSYTFSGNANEAVIISAVATSGTLSARAELYDPAGTFLGSNGGGNTSTSSLRLPLTGTYTILVYDFGFNDTGTYDVNLQFTTGRCGTPFPCGQTMSGNITSRARQDSYSFTGNANEAVIISAVATSGTLSARAELYDPAGTFLGSNGGGNTSTSSLHLPLTGTYTILVYDFGFKDTGTYDVNLQLTTGRCGIPIFCGQTLNRNITSRAQQDAYAFCGRQGGLADITARAISGSLSARVEVYDPSGTFLGSNGGGNTNTGNLTLSSDGNYTIIVHDFGFNDTGIYNVSIACTGFNCIIDNSGDINNDGNCNSTDALIILSFDVGLSIPPEFLDRIKAGIGDVNADNLTNSTDALIILAFDAGQPVPFPICQPLTP